MARITKPSTQARGEESGAFGSFRQPLLPFAACSWESSVVIRKSLKKEKEKKKIVTWDRLALRNAEAVEQDGADRDQGDTIKSFNIPNQAEVVHGCSRLLAPSTWGSSTRRPLTCARGGPFVRKPHCSTGQDDYPRHIRTPRGR